MEVRKSFKAQCIPESTQFKLREVSISVIATTHTIFEIALYSRYLNYIALQPGVFVYLTVYAKPPQKLAPVGVPRH